MPGGAEGTVGIIRYPRKRWVLRCPWMSADTLKTNGIARFWKEPHDRPSFSESGGEGGPQVSSRNGHQRHTRASSDAGVGHWFRRYRQVPEEFCRNQRCFRISPGLASPKVSEGSGRNSWICLVLRSPVVKWKPSVSFRYWFLVSCACLFGGGCMELKPRYQIGFRRVAVCNWSMYHRWRESNSKRRRCCSWGENSEGWIPWV